MKIFWALSQFAGGPFPLYSKHFGNLESNNLTNLYVSKFSQLNKGLYIVPVTKFP